MNSNEMSIHWWSTGGEYARRADGLLKANAYYRTAEGWVTASSREEAWDRYIAYVQAGGALCHYPVYYGANVGHHIADGTSLGEVLAQRGLPAMATDDWRSRIMPRGHRVMLTDGSIIPAPDDVRFVAHEGIILMGNDPYSGILCVSPEREVAA